VTCPQLKNTINLQFWFRQECIGSLTSCGTAFQQQVADISALASWYCGGKNYDQPIIIIIDDLEQCSGDVLGELVMMLR
jgi:origin recognition complex subunit 3